MADHEIDISVRIEFFRDMKHPHLLQDATAEKDYAGAMSRDGFKALAVPRVGEYVLALNVEMPYPYSPVTAVEHGLSRTESDPTDELVRGDSPSVTVVVRMPCPSDGAIDGVVQKFRERGWAWLAHQPDPE